MGPEEGVRQRLERVFLLLHLERVGATTRRGSGKTARFDYVRLVVRLFGSLRSVGIRHTTATSKIRRCGRGKHLTRGQLDDPVIVENRSGAFHPPGLASAI